MKKVLLPLLAAAGLAAAAAPAAAQSGLSISIGTSQGYGYGQPGYGYGHPGYGYGQPGYGYGQQYGMPIEARLQRIDQRIRQGFQRGRLTRREAATLDAQLRGVANLHARYSYNGLSRGEYADLSRRLDILQERLRWERRDDDRRGYSGW